MQDINAICGSIQHASETRNVDEMLALYDEEAALKVIDRNHPPSMPLEFHGKPAIAAYLRDIFGREMNHRITDTVIGDHNLAFSEDCEYPDGSHVFTTATVELRDGKIVREVEVQAWDGGQGT